LIDTTAAKSGGGEGSLTPPLLLQTSNALESANDVQKAWDTFEAFPRFSCRFTPSLSPIVVYHQGYCTCPPFRGSPRFGPARQLLWWGNFAPDLHRWALCENLSTLQTQVSKPPCPPWVKELTRGPSLSCSFRAPSGPRGSEGGGLAHQGYGAWSSLASCCGGKETREGSRVPELVPSPLHLQRLPPPLPRLDGPCR
jgi:hypothetical protein